MQNWQKNRNYRKYANSDGSFTYVITVDGEDVEVSAEVYKAYSQADRRERYCSERDAGRLLSLERMDDDDMLLSYLTERHVESAEDTAIRSILMEQILEAFQTLKEDDQRLLRALIVDDVTEREYAVQIGLSQKGVNKRRHRALEKVRKILGTQPD